ARAADRARQRRGARLRRPRRDAAAEPRAPALRADRQRRGGALAVTSRAAALALALALLALGCESAPHFQGAANFLRSAEAEKPVILREKPASELPAPEGLRAVSGELRMVPLKWDPVLLGDVGGYVIERSLREKGDFQRVGTSLDRFATSFVDKG